MLLHSPKGLHESIEIIFPTIRVPNGAPLQDPIQQAFNAPMVIKVPSQIFGDLQATVTDKHPFAISFKKAIVQFW